MMLTLSPVAYWHHRLRQVLLQPLWPILEVLVLSGSAALPLISAHLALCGTDGILGVLLLWVSLTTLMGVALALATMWDELHSDISLRPRVVDRRGGIAGLRQAVPALLSCLSGPSLLHLALGCRLGDWSHSVIVTLWLLLLATSIGMVALAPDASGHPAPNPASGDYS